MASTLMTLVTVLATILVQILLVPLLELGDLINHPLLYLSLFFLGVLLWCFGSDPSRPST